MLPKLTNVGKLYAVQLFSSSIAIYTLFAVMFSERGGLEPAQIGFIFATHAITILVAEIPTGILADKFSRKWTIVASKLLLSLGIFMWFLEPSFAGYMFGMILMGIGDSMSSGATQAYLYETGGVSKERFTKTNTRLWTMSMFGFVLGTGIASLLAPDFSALLLISALAPLIGAAFAVSLSSDRKVSKKDAVVTAVKSPSLFVEGLRYILSSKVILIPVLTVLVLKTIVEVQIENIPLYYRDSGVSVKHLPLVFLVGNIISVIMFWFGEKIAKFFKKHEIVYGMFFLVAMVITSRLPVFPAVLGMFWLVRFVRIIYIYHDGEIQHHLTDKHRATTTSIYCMASQLLTAFSFIIIGAFSSGRTGVVLPITVFAVIGMATYFAFLPRKNSLKNITKRKKFIHNAS